MRYTISTIAAVAVLASYATAAPFANPTPTTNAPSQIEARAPVPQDPTGGMASVDSTGGMAAEDPTAMSSGQGSAVATDDTSMGAQTGTSGTVGQGSQKEAGLTATAAHKLGETKEKFKGFFKKLGNAKDAGEEDGKKEVASEKYGTPTSATHGTGDQSDYSDSGYSSQGSMS